MGLKDEFILVQKKLEIVTTKGLHELMEYVCSE